MNTEINELEKIETVENNFIRKGGKQKSGKPPLKDSNFYFQISTSVKESEVERNKLKEVVVKLSERIEKDFLIMEGSEQGLKDFNLPRKITREDSWLRVVGNPIVKFYISVGQQTGYLYLHYLYAISKRGLDSQILNETVVKFLRTEINPHIECKPFIYRDAKADINLYIQKNPCL